ncbi:protein PET117 homolog, mitochondrial [Anolis carolinensis]|uniref:protein PET117 homolog, mitochondrial n=1 Tax=Anolis carolinensis TaxID=28377 RepID=UPI000462E4FA|nr:PREDICTED: protein PET117 homolog, mitochondrial [Anolis carolinensis]|eukprot:XP_008107192.1 PREDICTED: protein PET117 homolog, mitochondrial [Anolis carolinensis]
MSTTSKVVLGASVLLSGGVVAGVHLQQRRLQERLREGVLRDFERQNRKQEYIHLLEEHSALIQQCEMESKIPVPKK